MHMHGLNARQSFINVALKKTDHFLAHPHSSVLSVIGFETQSTQYIIFLSRKTEREHQSIKACTPRSALRKFECAQGSECQQRARDVLSTVCNSEQHHISLICCLRRREGLNSEGCAGQCSPCWETQASLLAN